METCYEKILWRVVSLNPPPKQDCDCSKQHTLWMDNFTFTTDSATSFISDYQYYRNGSAISATDLFQDLVVIIYGNLS